LFHGIQYEVQRLAIVDSPAIQLTSSEVPWRGIEGKSRVNGINPYAQLGADVDAVPSEIHCLINRLMMAEIQHEIISGYREIIVNEQVMPFREAV